MKIILSRKGFDSSSGGCPSPLFPDGSMVSLPIPDKQSPIRYHQIRWHEYDLGKIVSDLTKGCVHGDHFAHLDPDLNGESLPRADNWLPLFGQTGTAQGHLRNNGVGIGDVFLYFGLFRDIRIASSSLIWDLNVRARHVIWGWLQVGEVLPVDKCQGSRLDWADYHPHFHRKPDRNNTVYIANASLELPGLPVYPKGAGVFRRFSSSLLLTAQDAPTTSIWELPKWFFPEDGRAPLSYHGDPDRWQKCSRSTRLNAAARGQEFVLDAKNCPESVRWIYDLITTS
jgi:hypothetical protein